MGPNFFFQFFQMPKASPNHIFCKNVMTLVPCDLKWNWNGVVRCDVSCKFWFLHVLAFAKRIFLWPTICLTHRTWCNDPFTLFSLNEDSWDTLSFYNILTYKKPRVEVLATMYSENQAFWGAANRDMSQNKTCFNSKIQKNWSLLCMGFKIILCLDLSILLWIS